MRLCNLCDAFRALDNMVMVEEAELRTLRADKELMDRLDRPWVKVEMFPDFEWMSDKTEAHPNYHGKRSSLSLREALTAAKEKT